MARRVRPLFGTDYYFSESGAATNINGEKIVNDYPPTAQNVASIFIHSDGVPDVQASVTVKCQFWSGTDWGPLHTVVDEDGTAITFDPSDDTDVEANMYAQPWWKLNDGWRIVLDRSAGSTAVSGYATVVEI